MFTPTITAVPSELKNMVESYISSPVIKSFLAGSFSGTCSTIVFQPLDLVKTRIQCCKSSAHSGNLGILTVVGNIVRNERVIGLWKGVVPSLSRTVPGIGVYFSSLHWLRNNVGTNDPSHVESFLLGMSARAISGVIMLPVTVVKTRFESGQFNYKSIANALVTIYKGEGAKGLYSGLSATLLRDAPFSGLYLMFYTHTKKMARTSGVFDADTPMMHFSCGILAGWAASFVTQPADVVKTHMQVQPHVFPTVRSTVIFIYQHHGALGFMRGVVPRCLRRALMAAMAWTVYEQMMKSLGIK